MTLDCKSEPVTGRDDDAGWPDLVVELIDLAVRQKLFLIVRMVWSVLGAKILIEFAMGGSEPSLGDRRCRLNRAGERNLLIIQIEELNDQEEIGIDRLRRHKDLCRNRAGDLRILFERLHPERDPIRS